MFCLVMKYTRVGSAARIFHNPHTNILHHPTDFHCKGMGNWNLTIEYMFLENVAMPSGTHFTDHLGYFGRSISTGDSKKHNIHPYMCLSSHVIG